MAAVRVTAGTYREVWQDAAPLNGGATLVITTGIRANAVSLSRVFGVLVLQTVAGAPDISAAASVVGGKLVVTLTNAAAAGNSATWQLNVLLTHSLQQGLDPSGPGCIYVINPAGGGGGGGGLVVENIAELRTWEGGITPTSNKAAVVKGYYAAADGGGGNFIWTTDVATPDNGGTVIVPTSLPRHGCWKALQQTPLNAKCFGARGIDTDDTVSIQNALDYASTLPNGVGAIFFPAGLYGFTQLVLKSGIEFVGEGSDRSVSSTGISILRKIGPLSGFVCTVVSYLENISFTSIGFEHVDNTSGDVIDFGAAVHCERFTLKHISATLQNPNKAFLRFVECDPLLVTIDDAIVIAAQVQAVPALRFEAPNLTNIFNLSLSNMLIEGFVNNTAPLILVADDYGGVSFNVGFTNLTFEPGPGGAIEARGLIAGPTFTNVASADCLDTWPIIHITRGLHFHYGYGPATFVGCFLHNITADALPSCFPPIIIGGFTQRLDVQGNPPIVLGASISILEGTTNPMRLANLSATGFNNLSSTQVASANRWFDQTTASDLNDFADVVFVYPEADTDYRIQITPSGITGAPAAGSTQVLQITNKTVNGFRIQLVAAPGVGASVTFEWLRVR